MRILIVQMGGLGDLVLTGDLVAWLKAARPDWRVSLACRAPQHHVWELLPAPPDSVVALDFNPYAWAAPSPELLARVGAVLERLRQEQPEVVVAAALAPTWFDWVVAAGVGASRAVAATAVARPTGLLPGVLRDLGLEERELEGPEPRAGRHEKQRYAELARELGVAAGEAPVWRLRETHREAAATRLAEMGLEPGRYLIAFPVGTANVTIKRWPRERFAAALRLAREEFSLGLLVAGSAAEQEELEKLREELGPGPPPVGVFAGGAGEIPLLGGLTAQAAAFLGNDSGPAHLAQAYGTPGVVVYGGGGHWQAYGPWGRGTLGMVHHLPCFDCEWDCLFGHAVCLEAIRVEPVLEALRKALGDKRREPQWISVQTFSSEALGLVADAATRYREAQQDRRERLVKILELQQAAEEWRTALETTRRAGEDSRGQHPD